MKFFLLSHKVRHCSSWSQNKFINLFSNDLCATFENSLPMIVAEVCNQKEHFNRPTITDNIKKNAKLHLRFGNNPCSAILLHAYNNVQKGTSEIQQQTFALAWALEMTQSYHLLLKTGKNGNQVNDALLLQGFINELLAAYFKNKLYEEVRNLFDETFYYTAIGNLLDYSLAKGKINKYADFTMEQYNTISEYKTSHHTFRLPFFMNLKLCNYSEESLFDHLGYISSDLGRLYQMQSEFEDCFGAESKASTTAGTDIQLGKCTWLAVTALEHCTPAQRTVFNACYGSNEPAHVERIKLLYAQLRLPQLYREEEGTLCESVTQRAEFVNEAIPFDVFSKLLQVMCNNY